MLMLKINLKIKNIILIYFQTINTLKNNYNYNTKYYHHYQVVRLYWLCFDFYKLYLNLNLKKEWEKQTYDDLSNIHMQSKE